MKEDIKNRWVSALTSGEYGQCKGELRNADGFCCLGVLTDMYAKEHSLKWSIDGWGDYRFIDKIGHVAMGTLTKNIMKWAGLNNHDGSYISAEGETYNHLPGYNDTGKSFTMIAGEIEKHWENM